MVRKDKIFESMRLKNKSFLRLNSKGQIMGLPFQLIFSIILIAVFIFAAFYGIKYFLERSEQVQVGQFLSDLKSKVNIALQATEKSEIYTFALPNGVKKVCFSNFNYLNYNKSYCPEFETYREAARRDGSNVFFCPPSGASNVGALIHYRIDCDGTDCLQFPSKPQPYCISNDDGVKVTLERNLGEAYVRLK
ncbi:MAG: hypothetical protein KKE23_00805 [Nanoarchaeota archaeon]|nr:hypothetical protein [Nanoarchaeota archaeon]